MTGFIRFIFLFIMLISLSIGGNASVDRYGQGFTRLLKQLREYPLRWQYYELFSGIDRRTGLPIFRESIRKEEIKDYPYYFQRYNKNKGMVIYEYYNNQLLMGSFLYKYIMDRKTKKKVAYLKVAIWYNPKGGKRQVNVYGYRGLRVVEYYNDFAILIRKVTYDLNGNSISETDFIDKYTILGELED